MGRGQRAPREKSPNMRMGTKMMWMRMLVWWEW